MNLKKTNTVHLYLAASYPLLTIYWSNFMENNKGTQLLNVIGIEGHFNELQVLKYQP